MGLLSNIITTREQLRFKKEQADLALQAKGFINRDGKLEVIPGSEADLEQQKIQVEANSARQFVKQQQNVATAIDTDRALKDFADSGGDTSHLNRLLAKNDNVKRVIQEKYGAQTFAPIDFVNDAQMLEGVGIKPEHYDTQEKKDIIKSATIKSFNGSEWSMSDLGSLSAEIGTLGRSSFREKERIEKRLQDFRSLFTTGSGGLAGRKQALAERRQEFTETQAGVTTTQKDIAAFETKRQELFTEFGGEKEFFNTDFTKAENKKKGSATITAMENLVDIGFSEADKKTIQNVASALPILDPITRLSDKEAPAFIENIFATVGAKLNLGNLALSEVQTRAAYAMFTNVIRHDLFGATQSEAELASFEKAYGNLGEKAEEVLIKFKLGLSQMREKLRAVTSDKDPALVHFKIGDIVPKLEKVDEILGQRIFSLNDKNLKGNRFARSRPRILLARQETFSALNTLREKGNIRRQPYADEWDKAFRIVSKRKGVEKDIRLTKNPYADNIRPKATKDKKVETKASKIQRVLAKKRVAETKRQKSIRQKQELLNSN